MDAPGLKALVKCLPSGIKAVVAAPATERSACGHSISLGQKLRVEETRSKGIGYYRVHGTPADAVKFALSVLTDFKPDLVVSGINHGANTGVSVYYSGTISAAREGFINHVPAIAVSLCSKTSKDFRGAADFARRLIKAYAAKKFPRNVMLNVNVPPLAPEKIRGVRVTKQAASRFIEEFVTEKARSGKKVYSLAGEIELIRPDGTSDEEAVAEGYISLTPLKLDLTEYDLMPIFETWAKTEKGASYV